MNRKDLLENHYGNYDEDGRLKNTKSHMVEYLTTMRYIKKYAKKGCKILEIGAGTGAYSVELAKQGYDVTAVEFVESNLEILKKNAQGIKNITCMWGDAVDLSQFAEDSFDLVLNLGPMYHLYSEKDKMKAITESIRVCKKGGICMFAYLSVASFIWNYGVRKGHIDELSKYFDKQGRIKDVPSEIFVAYFVDEFKKQFDVTNTIFITNVATDSLALPMREYLDNEEIMNDEKFKLFMDWHFKTCERQDQVGCSSHLLYICKKK